MCTVLYLPSLIRHLFSLPSVSYSLSSSPCNNEVAQWVQEQHIHKIASFSIAISDPVCTYTIQALITNATIHTIAVLSYGPLPSFVKVPVLSKHWRSCRPKHIEEQHLPQAADRVGVPPIRPVHHRRRGECSAVNSSSSSGGGGGNTSRRKAYVWR